MNWTRKLKPPVETRSGETLRTLEDARAYVLSLPRKVQDRTEWQHVAKLMMEAAEGGSLEAVTRQVVLALLLSGKWKSGEVG